MRGSGDGPYAENMERGCRTRTAGQKDLLSIPKEKPVDLIVRHVGTSKAGGILNRGTRASVREEGQRGKGPLKASLGLVMGRGPTTKGGPFKETNTTQVEEAQRLDLINIEIQANLIQSKSKKETKKMEGPARGE